MTHKAFVTAVVLLVSASHVSSDYQCVCNYNVEQTVLSIPDVNSSPIGYLYEFDCKPIANVDLHGKQANFYGLQFEHQIGYVEKNAKTEVQTCPGDLPNEDKVTTSLPSHGISHTTPKHPSHTITDGQTENTSSAPRPTTTTTTPRPTTTPTTLPPTTSTTTPRPTTTTTTPRPTTTTTTPRPTTTTTTPRPTTTTTKPRPTTTTTTPRPTTTTTTPRPTTTTTTPRPTTTRTTQRPTATTTSPRPTTTTTTPRPTTTTTTPRPTTTTTKPRPTTTTTTPRPTTTTTTQRPTATTTSPRPTTTTTTPRPTTTTPLPTTTTTTTAKPSTTTVSPYSKTINVSGSPLQYFGVGYNLLTGNPELTADPGLLLNKRIFEITGSATNPNEVIYATYQPCVPSTETVMISSSLNLQNERKQFVIPSDNHVADVKQNAFAYNLDFQTLAKTLDSDMDVYRDTVTSCKSGHIQTKDNGVTSSPFVSREFAKAVCSLPLDLQNNQDAYFRFLDAWGTSVIMAADVGTRTISRSMASVADVIRQAQEKNPSLLSNSGPLDGYVSSITIDKDRLQHAIMNYGSFRTTSATQVGSDAQPSLIRSTVVPINEAVTWKYFSAVMDNLAVNGICPDVFYGNGLVRVAQNLKLALTDYARHQQSPGGNAHGFTLNNVTDASLQIPVTWPVGSYGLMKTASGCPGAKVTWASGWRKYDTEDVTPHNDHSPDINHYLAGSFGKNVRTEFCIKTTSTSPYSLDWPRGDYCIMQKGGHCPTGFSGGYVYWDDENTANANDKGGTLPDGEYNKNTKIFYCCRNDGNAMVDITLPRDRPFILLRYRTQCQRVYNMNVQDIFLRWDDNDVINHDSVGGAHPYDEGGSHNHQLHFCYYQSHGPGGAIIG